jgi:hypothetical protein
MQSSGAPPLLLSRLIYTLPSAPAGAITVVNQIHGIRLTASGLLEPARPLYRHFNISTAADNASALALDTAIGHAADRKP